MEKTRSKFSGAIVSPTKERATSSNRSRSNENLKFSENFDPNMSDSGLKLCNSKSIINSGNSATQSGSRNANFNQVATPSAKKKIRERKFVVTKKKLREDEVNSSALVVACQKCRKANGKSKCLCVAYESLRASHEEFFKNRDGIENEVDFDSVMECNDEFENEEIRVNVIDENTGTGVEGKDERNDVFCESNGENGELCLKRRRDKLLEEARDSVPEAGAGRVMHLVKAFEKLRMIPKPCDSEEKEAAEAEDPKKGIKWALPGLQQPNKVLQTQISSSALTSLDFFLTSESLGLDSRSSYSSDSNQGSISIRTSARCKKSRRSSIEYAGTFVRSHWKRKQQKATSQKPFMLTTEQRGRHKEEEFMKKLQKRLEEEEKLRIPIAQGLPWTTDEPEIPVKPPVKESTKPLDLALHSDTRAMERAEFDNQVAKKMDLIEQYKFEMERQQRLAEEEDIRRLKKELVPKAQPMPYFDKPFIPRRSVKHPTIPKEPKFRLHQHKKIKSYMSSDDVYSTGVNSIG